MAVDVHVMPLWRFKAGDFSSPIEAALGIKPSAISLAELVPPTPPWHLRLLSWLGLIELVPPERELSPAERREKANRDVNTLKDEISRLIGTAVDWHDEGEVVYSEQFHEPKRLRAFAAWFDHRERLPDFPAAPKGNYYEHPIWKLPKPGKQRFPTLVGHSLYNGYLLPVAFDGVHLVEPFKVNVWEFFHSVASTYTLRREVSELIELANDLPQMHAGDNREAAASAHQTAQQLKSVCDLGIERGLPVIFHG